MKKTQLYSLFLILCISLIILASSVQSEDFAKGKLKKDKQVDVKENKIIERAGKGKINFKNSFNVSVEDVDDSPNVYFSDNVVSVNTKELPELNQPATITFYDIDFETLPVIYYNEEFTTNSGEITGQCPEDICYNVNYDKEAKTISFDVAHFSSYKIGGGSWPIKSSENIISLGKSLTIGLPYGLYYDQWNYYFSPLYDYAACPPPYRPVSWTDYQNCLDSNILLPKCTQGSQIADDGVTYAIPQGHSKLWGYLYVFDDDEYQFTTGSSYPYCCSYRSECFSSPDASRIIVEGTIAYTSEKTGGSGIPPCKDSLSSFAGSTLVRDWPGSSYGVDCMRDLSSIPLSKGFHQIGAEAYSSYNYYSSYNIYVWKDYYPGISSPWTPPYAFLYKIDNIKGNFTTPWSYFGEQVLLQKLSVNMTSNNGIVDIIVYINDSIMNSYSTLFYSFASSGVQTVDLPPINTTSIRYDVKIYAESPLTDIEKLPILYSIDLDVNHKPKISVSSQANVFTNENITCTGIIYDSDPEDTQMTASFVVSGGSGGGNPSGTISCQKNVTTNSCTVSLLIPDTYTRVNDTIICKAIPNDGYEDGKEANATTFIENRAPLLATCHSPCTPSVTITPKLETRDNDGQTADGDNLIDEPSTFTELKCEATVTDPDEEDNLFEVTFLVYHLNGDEGKQLQEYEDPATGQFVPGIKVFKESCIGNSCTKTVKIDPKYTAPGDNVRCAVKAIDPHGAESEYGYDDTQILECVEVVHNGDPSSKFDVTFVGEFYKTFDDLKQFKTDAETGYNNIISKDPFSALQSKFNFYRVDSTAYLGCSTPEGNIYGPWKCNAGRVGNVYKKCKDTEKTIVSINSDKGRSNADYLKGYAMIKRGNLFQTAHEFAHLLGLADEYAIPNNFNDCYDEPNCGSSNLYVYPANENPAIIANPNPCSKWCDSVKPASEYTDRDCLNRNEEECDNYVLNGPMCVWLPGLPDKKDLFFDSQCVKVEGHENICTDVKDEYQQYPQVGCYYGSGGPLKWRSTDHNCLMYDQYYGEFSPVSTKYIRGYFVGHNYN
ncbi:hypothetical protein J4209_05190 [Candidatus Woesearchaeota archaeon]|nr:hypothetical protein [Candidatus Woesearchaeota archaeon]